MLVKITMLKSYAAISLQGALVTVYDFSHYFVPWRECL